MEPPPTQAWHGPLAGLHALPGSVPAGAHQRPARPGIAPTGPSAEEGRKAKR